MYGFSEHSVLPIFSNFEDRMGFGGFLGFRVAKFSDLGVRSFVHFVPLPGDSGVVTQMQVNMMT
jgi:hypothetical protein